MHGNYNEEGSSNDLSNESLNRLFKKSIDTLHCIQIFQCQQMHKTKTNQKKKQLQVNNHFYFHIPTLCNQTTVLLKFKNNLGNVFSCGEGKCSVIRKKCSRFKWRLSDVTTMFYLSKLPGNGNMWLNKLLWRLIPFL